LGRHVALCVRCANIIVPHLENAISLPKGKALFGGIFFGSLGIGGSYACLYWGLQVVPPGLTQVILALVPLLTLLFAILHRQESFRWQAFFGALPAAGGIALVFGEQVRANTPLPYSLAIVLATVLSPNPM
jgi:drug/metabolite transporter (DMT)-like permease